MGPWPSIGGGFWASRCWRAVGGLTARRGVELIEASKLTDGKVSQELSKEVITHSFEEGDCGLGVLGAWMMAEEGCFDARSPACVTTVGEGGPSMRYSRRLATGDAISVMDKAIARKAHMKGCCGSPGGTRAKLNSKTIQEKARKWGV